MGIRVKTLNMGGLALGASLLVASIGFVPVPIARQGEARDRGAAQASVGVSKLRRLYEQWRARHEASGGDHRVVIPLGTARSAARAQAALYGSARLDLIDGRVDVEVRGLAEGKRWNLWLVDNGESSEGSALFDAADQVWNVGTLARSGAGFSLHVALDPSKLAVFEVDLIVVAEALPEGKPSDPAIFGLPRAFQRMYTRARRGTLDRYAVAARSLAQQPPPFLERLAQLSGISSAAAAMPTHIDPDTLLSSMVAAGSRLFFNETFAGNGRTCGSCHPSANNFTLDPDFIARLPASDPLFIAERDPALAGLENPALLRSRALILVNIDGFAEPGVLRSVPHVLSMSQSLSPPICVGLNGCTVTFPDGRTVTYAYGEQTPFVDVSMSEATGFAPASTDPLIPYPVERTGWSGDGAPGSGSLREFSLGAVTQHFPKRLMREVGVDFRLPTDIELDALELFQLSLGRLDDPELSQLSFKHPVVERGKQIFMRNDTEHGTLPAGKCQTCHFNAGANITPEVFGAVIGKFGLPITFFGNPVFSTGLNNLPADQTRAPSGVARDAGMGIRALGANDCFNAHLSLSSGVPVIVPEPGTGKGGFGSIAAVSFLPTGMCLEQFNTPPLVEAADTAPFFHNNAFDTLEEAVAFYGTDAFNHDPAIELFLSTIDSGGIGIRLDADAVSAVAHFLRVLNTLDNLRQAGELDQAALAASDKGAANELLDQAWEELKDARQVLTQTRLHPKGVAGIVSAIHLNRLARALPAHASPWRGLLRGAGEAMSLAKRDLLAGGMD